ncbi:MAG: helix-turn-helix domain-containing protein [Myxococcales bacterium]|nr:helix-turn-helix domain-containing protein [Myxococcales bacterium]
MKRALFYSGLSVNKGCPPGVGCEISSFKIGKDWRFHKEALLKWVEEQQSRNGIGVEPGRVS